MIEIMRSANFSAPRRFDGGKCQECGTESCEPAQRGVIRSQQQNAASPSPSRIVRSHPCTGPGIRPAPFARDRSSEAVRNRPLRHSCEPNHARTRRAAAHRLHFPSSPITRTPPGRRTRAISLNTGPASATKQRIVTATTTSKRSGSKGMLAASPIMNEMSAPSRFALALAASTISGEASMPVTVAPRRHSSTARSPSPQPTSRTLRPRMSPRRIRISRRCSCSVMAPMPDARHFA